MLREEMLLYVCTQVAQTHSVRWLPRLDTEITQRGSSPVVLAFSGTGPLPLSLPYTGEFKQHVAHDALGGHADKARRPENWGVKKKFSY